MNGQSRKAMWWYAVAGVLLYVLVTFCVASAVGIADEPFLFLRRLAMDLASVAPGTSMWAWMDWGATVGGFSVTMAIGLLLAVPMGLAIYLAKSNRKQHEQRNAVVNDERLREQTRQKMRRTRAAG